MDIIFYIFIPSSWLGKEEGNYVWNNLHSMYVFALIIAIIVTILKVYFKIINLVSTFIFFILTQKGN